MLWTQSDIQSVTVCRLQGVCDLLSVRTPIAASIDTVLYGAHLDFISVVMRLKERAPILAFSRSSTDFSQLVSSMPSGVRSPI